MGWCFFKIGSNLDCKGVFRGYDLPFFYVDNANQLSQSQETIINYPYVIKQDKGNRICDHIGYHLFDQM